MCYSALVRREAKYLERQFGAIVVREQYDDYHERSTREPTKFPPLADRIFPGHYAPVIHERAGRRVAELMRYNIDPPSFIKAPGKLTCYNARRDNLESAFWSDSFMKHHGLVALAGFYEWVAVSDLIKSGEVTLADVKSEFERQADARRTRIETAGKAYKPTPTEQKDPRFRKIIIEFKTKEDEDLLVPVIFTERIIHGVLSRGFAIVTDEPPLDVLAAGHDRCPIFLTKEATVAWLQPEGKTAKEMLATLDRRPTLSFRHELDRTA